MRSESYMGSDPCMGSEGSEPYMGSESYMGSEPYMGSEGSGGSEPYLGSELVVCGSFECKETPEPGALSRLLSQDSEQSQASQKHPSTSLSDQQGQSEDPQLQHQRSK